MESLSVGYDGLRDTVLERAVALGEKGRVQPLLVRGEWGTGKSHFGGFVRALARDLDVASAFINLNARSHALNYPQRFYPALAESCRLQGLPIGLQQILTTYLISEKGRESLQEFATRHPGELARALSWLCLEFDTEEGLSFSEHPAWTTILGSDLAWAPYAYKRSRAFLRIGEMASLFRALGARGLILVFDEVETIDQLWNIRSRVGAYSTLGELARMENVWCIFAITARFDAVVQADLGRGILNDPSMTQEAKWFLRAFDRRDLDVVAPPSIDIASARELAKRIRQLYEQAHGFRGPHGPSLGALIDAWSRDPRRNPRTLIRLIIDELDRIRPLSVAP